MAAANTLKSIGGLVDERQLVAERPGLPADDPCWRVPWLEAFLDVPADATWPRLMTVPHPRAVGSLGDEFVRDAELREEERLWWWQRLVAARLLEIDEDGRLVWDTLVLTVARQVGKSTLLRKLCLWRMHQHERFGERQDVVHTGKDLAVCKEVQRPAIWWARQQPGDPYRVVQTNGHEMIERREDGSRWLLRAKEAAYSFSTSLAAVDEAWKVTSATVDESLVPTLVQREQPQLLLMSTAHRRAEALMLQRRHAALDELETGDGDLLIEWSAPREMPIDDPAGWRLASPAWTRQREKLVRGALGRARAGEVLDPTEPDPEESFRAQWLNQWPRALASLNGSEPLLPPGLWDQLGEPVGEQPLWFVAVEDKFGEGAAVAAAARLHDGRFQVDGWLCRSWDTALLDVRRLAVLHTIRDLQVGASMLNRVPPQMTPTPRPAGISEVRPGLALLRDLAADRQLVHDQTDELDQVVAAARVKENPSGLALVTGEDTHLVKALVWALAAAHKPAPTPRVF